MEANGRHVAKHNNRVEAQDVENLINDRITAVKTSHWKNYCEHIRQMEDEMWRANDLQDTMLVSLL